MKKELFPLVLSLVSVVPFGGGTVASYVLSSYFRDFMETLRYYPIILGLSILSTFPLAFFFLTPWLYEILAVIAVVPLVVAYVNSRRFENLEISVNEYYIEIKFQVPVRNFSFDDPGELFEYVYEKALKRVKPPYLFKLKNLTNCTSLRVVPGIDSITLRKRCGDTAIEIIVTNNKNAAMKVTMPY